MWYRRSVTTMRHRLPGECHCRRRDPGRQERCAPQPVRNKENSTFDIHDRVNYAVEKSSLILNRSARTISLILSIDTSICAVMDYFEIFLTRMMLSKRAAEYLDLSFKLEINGTQFL